VVVNATRDAINALVGGLEFDVEDEQVANELMLERQLAKGAFDAAEKAAVRARLLSVSLVEDLARLIKDTRRDLRTHGRTVRGAERPIRCDVGPSDPRPDQSARRPVSLWAFLYRSDGQQLGSGRRAAQRVSTVLP
jgi:hypothetical protein